MIPVTVSGSIWDTGSGVKSAVYSVVDEYGVSSTRTPKAFTLGAGGSYSFTIYLQAWRLGDDLDGRQYKVVVSATDNAGNLASVSTVVTVPHDYSTQKPDPKQPDEPSERNRRKHGRRALED
jgi:hypothetical protein